MLTCTVRAGRNLVQLSNGCVPLTRVWSNSSKTNIFPDGIANRGICKYTLKSTGLGRLGLIKGTGWGERGNAGSSIYLSPLLRIRFLCRLHMHNNWQNIFRSGNLCSFNRKISSCYVIGNPVYRGTSVPRVFDASVKAYSNRKKPLNFVSSSKERQRWITTRNWIPLKLQDIWNSKWNVVVWTFLLFWALQ